ncbi:twin-arginine translocase TatA/TatE family subunit [bacterium]|nr:twin-arginine translocase TatA/TatE family subunit [bacterium]
MIGSTELIVIVLVIVVLFGASAIPKFARSLGQAKAEFEKGFKDGKKAPKEPENGPQDE